MSDLIKACLNEWILNDLFDITKKTFVYFQTLSQCSLYNYPESDEIVSCNKDLLWVDKIFLEKYAISKLEHWGMGITDFYFFVFVKWFWDVITNYF